MFFGMVVKTRILKFQMGITGLAFGPIGIKSVPSKSHDRALAQGKGHWGPGINNFRKTCEDVSFFQFSTCLKNEKTKHSHRISMDIAAQKAHDGIVLWNLVSLLQATWL